MGAARHEEEAVLSALAMPRGGRLLVCSSVEDTGELLVLDGAARARQA